MMRFNREEMFLLMLYNPGTREGLVAELHAMRECLTPGERRLRKLVDRTLEKLSALLNAAYDRLDQLDGALSRQAGDALAQAAYGKDVLLPAMGELRAVVDQLETLTDAGVWPYPSYGELMFRV